MRNKSKKYFLILLFAAASFSNAQTLQFGTAKGLFMSVAIGPKIPVFSLATNHNLGIGFDFGLSYTDNKWLPVFLYSRIGFQHFPGAVETYKTTDYSAIASNLIYLSPGVRFYLPPLIENVAIVMPVIDVGLTFAFMERAHRFKLSSIRSSYTEEVGYTGFHVGGGVSMFLLDVVGYYHFIRNNQSLSFDVRIRIPIYMIF
ncbi:MAG: hypothetical protein K9G44_05030 [Melioribacteraceae bacterium]|nr:hypothetical protein [Melioribacteraceae bacterium]